jgi:hypothetical protein
VAAGHWKISLRGKKWGANLVMSIEFHFPPARAVLLILWAGSERFGFVAWSKEGISPAARAKKPPKRER